MVGLISVTGCSGGPGSSTPLEPLDTFDVIQPYTVGRSGHCDMGGRRMDITSEGLFVEHRSPTGLRLDAYLGCEVAGPVTEATSDSLTASLSATWTAPGCWLILGPVDAPVPFEMRAFSATGTLVYDRASDSAQIDVVYQGMLFGEARTMTCTHYAEHFR